MADNYVTTVIRFVEQGVFKPVVPNVLEYIDSILVRTERLLDDPQAEGNQGTAMIFGGQW